MKAFYKFIGSRWFSLPVVGLPFVYILYLFVQGGGLNTLSSGKETSEPQKPVEKQSTDGDENSSSEDDFDLSLFTVSEEEFKAVTVGDESQAEEVVVVNLHEVITDETGKFAILYLVFVLCLSPLKVMFRRNKFISALNRHRRMIGVASFYYACLHFGIYLVNGLKTIAEDIYILYIQAGLLGFSVLLILAVTSNNWSQRKLGGRKWKRLHRIVYLLIPVLFYHQAFAGKVSKETILEALVWFSPLLLLQPIRIYLTVKNRKTRETRIERSEAIMDQ